MTACHVLNRVPTNRKDITPFGGARRKDLHFLIYRLGLFGKRSMCW
jgi:hypothetical protein